MGLRPTLPPASPLERLNLFKRKLVTTEDDEEGKSFPKKVCIEVEMSSDEKNSNNDAKSSSSNSSDDSGLNCSSNEDENEDLDVEDLESEEEEDDEEDKENQDKRSNSEDFDSILAKTLHESATSPKAEKKELAENPKVIVEHQPLPSIYELHQNSTSCDTMDADQFDSGLSDESSEEEEEDEEELDDSDEEPVHSPLFSSVLRMNGSKNGNVPATPVITPPKSIYNDRFWSQSSFQTPPVSSATSSPSAPPLASTPPPPSATSPLSPLTSNAFQFLNQSDQRIECAENGKSYLQLGTMSHSHHLPVTPVIQPKPNMVYRRPIPPFRNQMIPQPARPVCDHSNCLQKKASQCYKNMRSRMLNLSLQKLHMARQTHEGSLRRSVLICNMLRHIEDETEREAIHDNQQQYASAAANGGEPAQAASMEMDHYWSPPVVSNGANPPTTEVATMTPSQYHLATGGTPPPPPPSTAPTPPPTSTTTPAGTNSYSDTYESTLKDFNTAFRLTPFSSPAHASSDMDSGIADEDRGINWGSVLSLSNQSELDPLNNNSFTTETWSTPAVTTSSPASSISNPVSSISTPSLESMETTTAVTTTGCLTATTTTASTEAPTSTPVMDSPMSTHSFDDIGWKLSADDVLRAFPNDENIFVGP